MPTDPAPAPSRSGRLALLAALALAALLEGAVAVRSPIIAPDGIHYIALARDLLAAPRRTMQIQAQHPGYPLLVAASHAALARGDTGSVEHWVWAARLPSLVAGVLGVGALWLLARQMFDERTAGVAAILFAVLPLARQNAADALGDAPHLLGYLLAAWAALAGLQTGRVVWFALAGTSSALAFWIRPEGASVAIVVAGLLVGKVVWGAPGERLRWATSLAAMLAFAVAVSAPYVVLSGKVTDKLRQKQNLSPAATSLTKVPRLAMGSRPAGVLPLAAISPTAALVTTSVLLQAGAELVEQYASQMNVLLPLAALGLFWTRSAAPRAESLRLVRSLAWFHAALLIALFILGGYIDRRHVLVLVALSMPWAAAGLLALAAWLADRPQFAARPRAAGVWACRLVLAVSACLLPRSLRPLHEPYRPQLAAAAWINAHAAPSDPLIANSPYIAFYTQRQTEIYGWSDYGHPPPLAERVRGETARFIVFDTGASEHYDPAWLEALNSQYSLAERFEGTGRAKRHTVLIYELTRMAARPSPSST